MLILSIVFLLLGAYLHVTSQMQPLDILCFVFAGLWGLGFLISRVKKAIWKIIRKPLYILLIICLIAMAITLIPIKIGVESQPEQPRNYLIVLGAKVDGTAPSLLLQDRIDAAYSYLEAYPSTICIATGGQGEGESISEAQCIANQLTAMGIDEGRIWLEDKSACTSENIRNSITLIEGRTGKAPQYVAILSNDFHLYRASLMAADYGLDAIYVASNTTGTANRIGYTLREIFALWKYLLIGE